MFDTLKALHARHQESVVELKHADARFVAIRRALGNARGELVATEAKIRETVVIAAMKGDAPDLNRLLLRTFEFEAFIAHLPEAVERANQACAAAQTAAASLATCLADAEHETKEQATRRKIEAALEEGQPREAVRLRFDISEREFDTYAPRVGG